MSCGLKAERLLVVIAVRCDEVVHPGRARSKHHGALRARDCIGGPSSFPGRFDGRGGGGCSRGVRAEPAGLWNRRVQDAVQVTPVRRPVCAGLACEAIKEADTSEVFCLGWFDANHSSSMCFACFQLPGGIARYSFSGDAQRIFVPEGVAGAAPVGGIRSHIGELIS